MFYNHNIKTNKKNQNKTKKSSEQLKDRFLRSQNFIKHVENSSIVNVESLFFSKPC